MEKSSRAPTITLRRRIVKQSTTVLWYLHSDITSNMASESRESKIIDDTKDTEDTVLSLLCGPNIWRWDPEGTCSISFNENGTGLVSLKCCSSSALCLFRVAADHLVAPRRSWLFYLYRCWNRMEAEELSLTRWCYYPWQCQRHISQPIRPWNHSHNAAAPRPSRQR